MKLDYNQKSDNFIAVTDVDVETIVVSSLLTAHKVMLTWHIKPVDFIVLKNRFDEIDSNLDMTEAAKERVQKIIEVLELNKVIKSGNNFKLNLSGIKAKLYLDQLRGVALLSRFSGAGLFDEMGIGKTLQALSIFKLLKNNGIARKAVVICPLSVKEVWMNQIDAYTDLKYVVTGRGKSCINGIKGGDVLIAHYQNLLQEDFIDFVMNRFDMLIIDEAHWIKNLGAKRSNAIQMLVQQSHRLMPLDKQEYELGEVDGKKLVYYVKDKNRPNVLLLTGTPVSENPMNAYAIMKILGHINVPDWKWEKHFVEKELVKVSSHPDLWVNVFKRFKNVEEIGWYMESFSIRRLRKDVPDMPQKVEEVRYVDLAPEQAEVYAVIIAGLFNEMKEKKVTIAGAMSKFIRLTQLTNNLAIISDLPYKANNKYTEIMSILEEVKGKVVIWSIYRKGCDLLQQFLTSKGIKSVVLYGGVNELEVVKQFVDGDANVAIATPQKMGTGIDFLKVADTAIYLDLPVSYVMYKQSQDRLVRRGKDHKVVIIELIARRTVDEVLKRILDRKRKLVDEIRKAVIDLDSFKEMFNFELKK